MYLNRRYIYIIFFFFASCISIPVFALPALFFSLIILLTTNSRYAEIRKIHFIYFFWVAVWFFITAYRYIGQVGVNYNPIGFNITYTRLLLAIVIGFVISLAATTEKNNKTLVDSISVVISIHVAMFGLQVIFKLLLGVNLDILVLITGETQRVLSNLGGFTLYRFSGFFNEPGTYGHVMVLLTTLYYILAERVDKVFAMSLLTILLTFSVSTYIAAIPLLAIAFVKYKKNSSTVAFILSIPIILLILVKILTISYNYIYNRFFTRSDFSFSQKASSFDTFFSLDPFDLIFGYGFSFIHVSDFHLIDSGVLINTVYGYGAIFVLGTLLFHVISGPRSFSTIALSLYPLVFIKVDLHYQLFWVYLFLVCILPRCSENRLSNAKYSSFKHFKSIS
ncbi:hypothetical protein ACTFBX_10490 [Aeromonas caviae]